MDYVKPADVITECLQVAEKKASLSIPEMLVTGVLSGVFLGFATSLVMVILAQGLPPIAGAIVFPVGFVILVLLGLELVTGNFALMPQALANGQIRTVQLLRNWGWVYLANLLGSLLYATLFYLAITNFGTDDGGAIGEQVRIIAKKKTLAYSAIGGLGWCTAMVKGILCNWMVTIGTVLAFASRSTGGKIAAMWLPIMIFFAHGYEHCVVNMYLIPSGMLLGAPITVVDWWVWNQVPVTIGNIISGAVFTGLALLFALGAKKSEVSISKFSLASCIMGSFLVLGVLVFSVTVWSETPRHQLEEGLMEPLTKFLPLYFAIFAGTLVVTGMVSVVFGSIGMMQIISSNEHIRGKALAIAGIIMSILAIIPPATKLPVFVKSSVTRQNLEQVEVFKNVVPGILKILFEPQGSSTYSVGLGFQTKYGIITVQHIFDGAEDVTQIKVADAFRKVRAINKKWLFDKDRRLDIALIPEMIRGAQALEITDTVGKVGESVLYIKSPSGEEYLPVHGKIKTVYTEPKSNASYLLIEATKPVEIGSPVINKKGEVLGLLVASGIGEGLALSISNNLLEALRPPSSP